MFNANTREVTCVRVSSSASLSLLCSNKLYIWLDILAGGCGRKVDTELQAAGHKWASPACVLVVSPLERVHPCGEHRRYAPSTHRVYLFSG